MTSDAIDASAPAHLDESTGAPPAATPVPRRLLSRLAAGTPYAVGFGGQGVDWLPGLADLVRTHALDLHALVAEGEALLAPVAADLGPLARGFAPLAWLDTYLAASSESVDTDTDAPAIPSADERRAPAYALPGVLLAQAAALNAIRGLGLDPRGAVTAIGHSQGLLAVEIVEGADAAEMLALARLIGAATQQVAPAIGLAGATMLGVALPAAEVEALIEELPASSRLVVGVRNGRTSTVVSGTPRGLERLVEALPEGVTSDPLGIGAAFHHPELAPAVDLVVDWAARAGLDVERAERLANALLVDRLDWPAAVASASEAGARWLVDLGPGDLITRLSRPLAAAYGVGTIAPVTPAGLRELTVVGAAPQPPLGWSRFAPSAVRLPDGSVRAETRFTRLTGRSPILLAGMTPTTVDPAIVAAAANAGHWAELAGGGQVTEEIFAANVERLGELLDEGRTAAFNALYLDPYLWRLQLGSTRLVQKARATGAPIDAVVVTAGVPELEEAAALVAELREAGIEHVVFKPGTVAQIKSVLAIADEVAPTPLIVQIEGGKAGGHHSWEDLDELLLATYADLRRRDNVVVCVGGGIGTPEVAARYLTGAWSEEYAEPRMPLDGVLVGTAAMACLEATTSPAVKQLLVETQPAQVVSGRSQLGADIHEIDNAASRCGALLDTVAGDADAVAERRDEIVAALALTAKPYFGDVTAMTYAAWLARFLELSAGEAGWLDVTLRDRFHAMLQRAEARLSEADHGEIPTLFESASDVEDGAAALGALVEAYDADVQLHPADLPFFLEVCARPGKPVPFVPVIDADVRRWYRSDSLWQAHDERYDADAVVVIPGPDAVAGITRADEPVAELLDRFEAAVVAAVDDPAIEDVPGRRRAEEAAGPVALALAAPDAVWAGRVVPNPLRRIGAKAEDLQVADDVVSVAIPLERGRLTLRLVVGPDVATGAAPVVDTPAEAMRELLSFAAADTGVLNDRLVAAHAAVTAVGGTRVDAVLDVLVGLAWPAVFAALSERDDVAEGFLDLVHLDHAISGVVPVTPTTPEVQASVIDVTDTEVGRVATVAVMVGDVRLTERFAIRGRTGVAKLTDPAVAGGVGDVVPTERRSRGRVTVTAPTDLKAFADVTGDHNPIHTSDAVARLAGLGGPIVHGMWISATAQRALAEELGRPVTGWTARFLAPVRPGAQVDLAFTRTGFVAGDEVVEVQASVLTEEGSTLVMTATARVRAARTAYVFPGQGIQKQGMGMEGYARSAAAKEIWDRADKHTREVLGFSVLRVVKENPTELLVDGTWHRHPDGVLFLTQFTQVAMAVLGSAQMAEMVEAGVAVDDAIIAGHSVGEYNALAAVSGVLALEAVVEIVFRRGSVMHALVPRDAEGRSNYRLAAIRPAQFGCADDDVAAFIEGVSEASGEFLQIANLNLRGSQYAIAGTVAGMDALQAEIERRRAAFGGKAAFVLVPGIDVPFHSRVLADGVADFRQKLDDLLPPEIDPALLVGRYVPNLVARPFALDRGFLEAILEAAPADAIRAALEDFSAWEGRDAELCRLLLVELLAWQFASPVRWIETQDLFFADAADGGLGVERLVEVGVGSAPTLANIAASTLKLPEVRRTLAGKVEVLNVERDAAVVFGRDVDEVVEEEPETAPAAETPTAAAPTPAVPTAPAAAPQGDVADIAFTAADATRLLLAWWTKTHPDDLAATDSIESLTDGASSRRNQLLMDLGAELGLGAIDGAAEAPIAQLTGQVQGLARGYKPFGPVLTTALGDHLKKVLGPIGARQSSVTDRVAQAWQLGSGWGTHVLAELALATRDTAIGGLEDAVDSAVQAVAKRHGVTVALASAGEAGGGVIDAAAAAELTGGITDALVASARTILARLGEAAAPAAASSGDAEARAVVARVEAELGAVWMRLTEPAFDERRAVLFDDRWASARTDVVRAALQQPGGADLETDLTGSGEAVAAIARWHGLDSLAERALDATPGAWAGEVAVVTGAGPDSIAEAVVAELLAGGATVVATTSNASAARIGRFRDLYGRVARAGAALWVVPANLASYADVDALVDWVRGEQVKRVGPKTEVVKPALHPTLLFPFAAGPAAGDLSDAGAANEAQARILLWSVERLIGAKWGDQRVHVVLPGSPNRGTFGGDGAYGETKAALDAVVAKWSAERGWPQRVTLAHAIIGWVAGTGLMGGNDPMIDAARAAGVRVWSPAEMAAELLALCTVEARTRAAQQPLHADFAEGLGSVNLRDIAEGMARPETPVEEELITISALPASPAAVAEPPRPEVARPRIDADDMVVIVGAAELGPWGSSRTRHEVEVGALSAAGVLELAWSTGLVKWDDKGRTWRETGTDEAVAESEIFERFHDAVVERCGIREYADDNSMVDGTAPLLVGVYLDEDLTFNVDTEAEARALQASHPDQTDIAPTDSGWQVTRRKGTQIRVPRRLELTRTVGGQVPTGFDPTTWGIPKEMADSVDRLALWNLVCTVDAFLGSGFTPAELLRWVHPSLVANTQGTGMGGMTSMQSLYLDTLLGEPVANDLLQEALPNVVAAHVMQSYVGGYGAMSHPVGACATTAISIEDGMDKIRLGKADFVVAGGYDDLGTEGVIGFAAMSATADTEAMRAQGIADNRFSRANDRRRGGFVEGQGGGTVLLARGSVAARMGLPVLGVVAYAASYADGIHSSIPAPGLGALAAGVGREHSPLARALAAHGLAADDIAVISKHDTSTAANDPNEADLHERLAAAIGRSAGNPLHVISQKTLTGHAKGGAAAFQVIGLCQTLTGGVIPPNRSLDCVDPEMAKHPHLVWHREALPVGPMKAGLVTSLGFGHVAGIVAIAHPEVFVAALPAGEQDAYRAAARRRRIEGALTVARTMLGEPGFVRRPDRRLGSDSGDAPRELEAAVLLDERARLSEDGIYRW